MLWSPRSQGPCRNLAPEDTPTLVHTSPGSGSRTQQVRSPDLPPREGSSAAMHPPGVLGPLPWPFSKQLPRHPHNPPNKGISAATEVHSFLHIGPFLSSGTAPRVNAGKCLEEAHVTSEASHGLAAGRQSPCTGLSLGTAPTANGRVTWGAEEDREGVPGLHPSSTVWPRGSQPTSLGLSFPTGK